jgi:1-aminocyclopropane-1-carboxylate deaminase/D-cysteine desulfhydrase-like pyridoxal-dependent ACC family enzyme
MLDILRNEQEKKISFDHICIDAGTGLMAAALTLCNHWLSRSSQIHVIQMAGKEGEFAAMLRQASEWALQLGFDASPAPLPELYRPGTARSFGSVNARVREEVRFLARNCGLLAEPVYVAKLFLSFREDARLQALEGNVLLIHSGGGTGLMGWEW